MKVIDGELLLGVFKEPVKDSSRQEESLIVTFEIGKHLNHPVDHSGPHLAIDFILYAHICELFETIFGVELGHLLALNHVSNDVWGQFLSNIDVLSVNISCLSSWQMTWGMVIDILTATKDVRIIIILLGDDLIFDQFRTSLIWALICFALMSRAFVGKFAIIRALK